VFRYTFIGNMIDILKEYALIFIHFSCYNFVPVSSNVLTFCWPFWRRCVLLASS